ncbi:MULTISPECIES: hypothetical protein [unclassified Bacillus cereus group]|uniref:hypothetical protein n=1 Tax=unclassified Bacillus cereus group TaxID=2750818 RepID=UPI001F5A6100|nr:MULTISPECIES: hypothetical protein [unclassified Bacillus cereus group]
MLDTDIYRSIRVASIVSTKNESFTRNFTEIILSTNCTTASKVTESLGFHTSHDTLLRLLYKMEPPTVPKLI